MGTSTQPAAVLAEAAVAAGRAPSINNTQPWRWRVDGGVLDLYAERGRQLAQADPDGRMLIISCGAVLHHALVALAAQGWSTTVDRLPDPADPDHLARITLAGRIPVTPAAMRMFQTIAVRHTDRRSLVEAAIPSHLVEELRRAAAREHTGLYLLRREDLAELAAAAARANDIGIADPYQRAELAYWIGGERPAGTGVPDTAIPAQPPRTGVPARDFGHPGTLSMDAGTDRLASYAILFGRGDQPLNWLYAGEALSACWLIATEHGVAVLPLSSVVEVTVTRQRLRHMLSNVDHPFLVLRLGMADPEHPGPSPTPRLPASEIIGSR